MNNGIEIYQSSENQIELKVQFENETVWLSQKQMAELFGKNIMTVNEHIKNIYQEGELDENPTIRKSLIVQKEGKRSVTREVSLYNLDVIISVGYRVKSKRGTQFRQWATQRLKDYLVKGYAINEKRLREADNKLKDLQQAIKLAAKAGNLEHLTSTEAKGILNILNQYAFALETLDKYDHQTLSIDIPAQAETHRLTYKDAIAQIVIWRNHQKAGKLFGNEKDQSFKSSLDTIYQTFDGAELYPSIEEKAANLLYFIVKNHSFSDGNKRIAAGLFVYFLDLNNKLLNNEDEKIIGDNALVAITIMIAESKADEKDMMVKLVVNLIKSR